MQCQDHGCLPTHILLDLQKPNHHLRSRFAFAQDLFEEDYFYESVIELLNKPASNNKMLYHTAVHIVHCYASLAYGRRDSGDKRLAELLEDTSLINAIMDYIGQCWRVLYTNKLYQSGRLPYAYERSFADKVMLVKHKVPIY